MKKKIIEIIAAILVSGMLAGCGASESIEAFSTAVTALEASAATADTQVQTETADNASASADSYTLTDGEDITIDSAGTYSFSGNAQNATIYVDADKDDEVVILLSGADITNEDTACIYVENAGLVTVQTEAGSENTLTVSGEFTDSGDKKGNAVIYSKDDLVLAGEGILNISSTKNGVRCSEEIRVESGTVNITECEDGIHAEDNDDDTKGNIVITGGTINITAGDDALHATTTVQIDGGTLTLTGAECIEATQITVNGGDIDISASDDGINASAKSSSLTPSFTLNGGNVVIKMGSGDTDGVDSNGSIYINGGTIDITGQSAFDYDEEGVYTGGTIIENGIETNTITNQFANGFGGSPGEFGGDGETGGFGDGEMPDFGGDGMQPPEFDGQMPEFNGEMPQPPEMNGEMPGSGKGPGGDNPPTPKKNN